MAEVLPQSFKNIPPHDSYDIVRPFLDAHADEPDIFVIGGLGSRALSHSDVRISEQEHVIAVPNLAIPSVREDGTVRDVDVFVNSADPIRTQRVEAHLNEVINDQLTASVCNIADGAFIEKELATPFSVKSTLLSGYVSNRYTGPIGNEAEIRRYIFPFSAPLALEHFDQWRVEVKDSGLVIPVPSPASTLSNYLVRSVIGLRPVDQEKTWRNAATVREKAPKQWEWLVDGGGKNHLDLSQLLRSLHRRGGERHLVSFEVLPGLTRPFLSHEALAEHELFAAKGLGHSQRNMLLAIGSRKSDLTLFFEEHPHVKAWYRTHIEAQLVRMADRRHDKKT